MALQIEEQETHVNFMRGDARAVIYTSDTTMMTKFNMLVEANGADWKVEEVTRLKRTGEVIGITYSCPVNFVSFRKKVVIPEVDAYTYGVMCANAGQKPAAKVLTKTNIYTEIIAGNNALDNAEVPETGRIIVVTPDVYVLMKQCKDITMETDIGNDMRVKGVIAMIDGAMVIKVPVNRLPKNFGFMIAHPCATVAPTKLEDYKIHEDPPGISGSLVEGRICYDACVLENKAKAIYYHAQTAEQDTPEQEEG